MGFIGGGNSNVDSSSCSRSCAAVECDDGNALSASSVCFSVGSLKDLSEGFLTSGRSDADVLSTRPCDSFRSGGGNHLRLKDN